MTKRTPRSRALGGTMTKLLAAAVRRASALDPIDQNALAWLLDEEMKSEERWTHQFAQSQEKLAAMEKEVLAAHRRGRLTRSSSRIGAS
jgi:hypothetical protein